MKSVCLKLLVLISFFVSTFVFPSSVVASHSWGDYHWARTSNPFSLKLGNNVSALWSSYLGTTASDWSVSTVLDTSIVAGGTNPKNCRPTTGRVEVCSSKYGNNGWLGIAQIWINGNHIVQGVTKVNDTYFNTSKYNTSAWRNLVMCQEVGHTLGLDHQDEIFDNPNLGTCMDYSNDPSTNQHPNQHDYDELGAIYFHLDSVTTLSQNNNFGVYLRDSFDNPSDWGRLIKKGDKTAVFERNVGMGRKIVTFVLYAD